MAGHLVHIAVGPNCAIEVFRWMAERKDELRGLRMVEQPPQLRHFTAGLVPL